MIPDIRICFVGDSFVNGTGDEAALGWAGRLCAAAEKQASVTSQPRHPPRYEPGNPASLGT